jgi:hypothetical protein
MAVATLPIYLSIYLVPEGLVSSFGEYRLTMPVHAPPPETLQGGGTVQVAPSLAGRHSSLWSVHDD